MVVMLTRDKSPGVPHASADEVKRCCSCRAASLPKVQSTSSPGLVRPVSNRLTALSWMLPVLPDPGPAMTSIGTLVVADDLLLAGVRLRPQAQYGGRDVHGFLPCDGPGSTASAAFSGSVVASPRSLFPGTRGQRRPRRLCRGLRRRTGFRPAPLLKGGHARGRTYTSAPLCPPPGGRAG